jgi:TonB family protein
MEPVTDVLIGRSREPEGLRRTLGYSVGAHAVVIAFLLLAPSEWRQPAADSGERLVMSISLGGAAGPQSGGMTPIGGRPIQAVAPPIDARRPEPIRPPAARTPEMTAPAPAPSRAQPREPVKAAPAEARGRTPIRGEEVRSGSAPADTGARGTGFGLSSGGGGQGASAYVDSGNFCCPEYLETMVALIRRNWKQQLGTAGENIVKFTIERDGRISAMELEKPSGYFALDLESQRALINTRQLPPLPSGYTESRLVVHLRFEYLR